MKDSVKVILTGARNSKLSRAQTMGALDKLNHTLPILRFEFVPMSSPGDRDRETDLRLSDADFFSRDLDEAVLNGTLNCAVHSAKDLPDILPDGLDFFWLPWREDPRDVIITRTNETLPDKPIIGVSSQRREEWSRGRYPKGILKPIRGNIDDRIRQLDAGGFDLLVLAAAGLHRLGLEKRITEYISLKELTPPPGQGYLALTFKKGNRIFEKLRSLFIKPVIFAGAGIGEVENTTAGVIDALSRCDVCIFDALCQHDLLENIPSGAIKIDVGKRSGKHSPRQSEINQLLTDYCRQGKMVVRLKGGDPGIFGRLTEELDALGEYKLPFRIMPGISSLNALTGAGIQITRRGSARGFTVSTPRKAGDGSVEWPDKIERDDFPQVIFMASKAPEKISSQMMRDGFASKMPVSVVYNAGCDNCQVVSGSLNNISKLTPDIEAPGLIVAGEAANPDNIYNSHGPLSGLNILFAGSEKLGSDARGFILDQGGRPITMPMIRLKPSEQADEVIKLLADYDWLIVPSPGSARLLLEKISEHRFDLRRLPKIAVSGMRTAAVLERSGIYPDAVPNRKFGKAGILNELKKQSGSGEKILRLSSDKADNALSQSLINAGFAVDSLLFYINEEIEYDIIPDFDAALFTSPSSVRAFIGNFGKKALNGKIAVAIGDPTRIELENFDIDATIIIAPEATLKDMVLSLALNKICTEIENE